MSEAISVGVREFRENLSRYLAEVSDGAKLTITSHGKTVAQVVPPAPKSKEPFARRVGGLKHLGPIPDGFDDFDQELDEMFHGRP